MFTSTRFFKFLYLNCLLITIFEVPFIDASKRDLSSGLSFYSGTSLSVHLVDILDHNVHQIFLIYYHFQAQKCPGRVWISNAKKGENLEKREKLTS